MTSSSMKLLSYVSHLGAFSLNYMKCLYYYQKIYKSLQFLRITVHQVFYLQGIFSLFHIVLCYKMYILTPVVYSLDNPICFKSHLAHYII